MLLVAQRCLMMNNTMILNIKYGVDLGYKTLYGSLVSNVNFYQPLMFTERYQHEIAR